MLKSAKSLLEDLSLEKIGENSFCGQSGDKAWKRVFGGHIIAQALKAAQMTVGTEQKMEKPRFVHSLHAYFIRPGNPKEPIFYHVEILRDGKSFSNRQIIAKQSHGTIMSMTCSFQIEETGLEYQRPMPDSIPMPEDLAHIDPKNINFLQTLPKNLQKFWALQRPFLIRPIDLDTFIHRQKATKKQISWFKLDENISDNQNLNAMLLAYVSDFTILDSSLLIHKSSIFDKDMQVASLDHAIWFHRPFSMQDWLLYEIETHNSYGARGLSRGFIYNRQGELIATVMQEGLLRHNKTAESFIH